MPEDIINNAEEVHGISDRNRYWDSFKESEKTDAGSTPEATKGVQSELRESVQKTFKNSSELEVYITTLAQEQQDLRTKIMQADDTISEENLRMLETKEKALIEILEMWQKYPKAFARSRGEKI